jgi:two-component system LytT family sensor kinase
MMRSFKVFTIVAHLTAWVLFMAFPLLFLNSRENENSLLLLQTWQYWLFGVTYAVLFYLNFYILIPRFFLRKKYIDYGIIALVLFSGVYFLQPFDKLLRSSEGRNNVAMQHAGPPSFGPPPDGSYGPGDKNGPPPPPNGQFNSYRNEPNRRGGPGRHHIDINSLFIFLMIMGISTAAKTVRQWQLTEQRAAQAEADKASAELSFLKAQINPHFLFNTLNNIYTLAVTQNEYTADSIMKLSNIMRYVTDEVTEDFVQLDDEINCISDYIELQRLRLGKNGDIDFLVTGNTAIKKIPPLVMMTFVENVFKYGISKHELFTISINIVATDRSVYFFCQNQIFINKGQNSRTGIGIKNTRQRLEYIYPGRHILNIKEENNLYTVQLTIQS